MKPKRKPVTPVLKDWPEVDITLTRLHQIDVKRKRLKLEMNAKIAAARDQYTKRLNDIGAEDKVLRGQVEQFCKAHREDFGKGKSVKRLHGVVSFRKSPPSVRLLNRKWNWDKVVVFAKLLMPDFVRQKFEINKDAVLDHHAKAEDADTAAEELASVGMKIGTTETFGIELKHEEAPEHVGA